MIRVLLGVGALASAIALASSSLAAGDTQCGIASWYGPGFDGRTAASGERFDEDELTAAHRTLPFGTIVQVTRADGRGSVQVRINDRGPYVGGRVIDLSRAAAEAIGMIGPGIMPVRITVISGGATLPGGCAA